MSLSQNIKRYRKIHSISQEYMGFKLHIDQSAYSRIEARDSLCAQRILQIAQALETTPEMLRNYHETLDAAKANEVRQPVTLVEELLQQKENQLLHQTEEIDFLKRIITYQQSVWNQYCDRRSNNY